MTDQPGPAARLNSLPLGTVVLTGDKDRNGIRKAAQKHQPPGEDPAWFLAGDWEIPLTADEVLELGAWKVISDGRR